MTQEQKNKAISAAIAWKILGGMSVPEAVDAVLGAGTYKRLADDVYETLRARFARPV